MEPIEHSLWDLLDFVLMDPEFHQGVGQVRRNLHQVVLGDVEFLQLNQRAKSLWMDLGDLIVHQYQGLWVES